jgi:FkbM family methyltransferase
VYDRFGQDKMSLQNKTRGWREIWGFDNRLSLICTRLLFPREELLVYRYKGLDILTDRAGGDSNGAREVLTSNMYRRFLPRMKFDGPANVLDLGANNGGFPLLLKTSGIVLKKVVSVEFNPRTFVRLHFNLLRNLTCETIPVNAALSGENSTLNVRVGKGSVSDNIYEQQTESGNAVEKIEGITLDNFYETYFGSEVIDICKIDVEGAEFDVFLRPNHSHLRDCRYLIMEIHERNGRTAGEILPVISELGFVRQPNDADADPTVHFFKNSRFE